MKKFFLGLVFFLLAVSALSVSADMVLSDSSISADSDFKDLITQVLQEMPLQNESVSEEYAEPILFRGIEWGSSYSDVLKNLSFQKEEIGFALYMIVWSPIENMMFLDLDSKYSAPLGIEQSFHPKDFKVADYLIDTVFIRCILLPDDNGLLKKNIDDAALIYASYDFKTEEPDKAFKDLTDKLTYLYGDVDKHDYDTISVSYALPSIKYEQNLWKGADGTMVSLVKSEFDKSGSISIKYGYKGADLLMEQAFDAFRKGEVLNGNYNTDGL